MSEPTFTSTTERIYARLPEAYRVADAAHDWTLKRWLSGAGDVLNDVDDIIARWTYVPPDRRRDWYAGINNDFTEYRERPADAEEVTLGWDPLWETSDLLDPRTADAAWLPWLAQLVGASLVGNYTTLERKSAILYGYTGLLAGSKDALRTCVLDLLTGDRFVRVYTHSDDTQVGTASMWHVLVVVRESESPGLDVIADAIDRKRAKPAGVVVHVYAYNITWDILEATYPDWDSVEAAGDWDTIVLSGDTLLP